MTDNPPAFPNLAPGSCGPHIDKRDGMTLRDYYAGQVLPHALEHTYVSEWIDHVPRAAEYAYRVADAMLEARKQTK